MIYCSCSCLHPTGWFNVADISVRNIQTVPSTKVTWRFPIYPTGVGGGSWFSASSWNQSRLCNCQLCLTLTLSVFLVSFSEYSPRVFDSRSEDGAPLPANIITALPVWLVCVEIKRPTREARPIRRRASLNRSALNKQLLTFILCRC